MERKIDRMLAYLKYKGISENKATVDCSLAKGLIYQAKSGKADIGAKAIEKVLATYEDISSTWLLTGEGPMLKSDQPENPVEEKPEDVRTLDRLFALIDDQRSEIKMLLNMLKEKDERIEELRKELDARKGKTASGADGSSVANVG